LPTRAPLRRHRGLTQEGLADLIGRTAETVSMLERGETTPKLETLIRLSASLSIPRAS
jgi:transcriptional regulator with XRE-family HTH domain